MTAFVDRIVGVWRSGGAFMRRPLGKRLVAILCAAWVAFLLAPLFAMAFYAYPQHDDFSSVEMAAKAWAQTGSLWETVRAAWQQAMYDYRTWQGTFVAMFVCAFQPMIFSTRLYWLTPFCTLALLALGAGYLVRQLARYVLKCDGSTGMALYAALMTLLVLYMPGVQELIYWQSAIQYTLSIVCVLFLLGLLVKLHAPMKPGLYAWRAVCVLLFGVALGGLPYTLALGGMVGMAVIAVWCLWRRSRARWAALLGALGVAAALAVVIVAPGNMVRQTRVGDSMHPVAAIVVSVLECLVCAADWFGPQLVAVGLLLAAVLWTPLKTCGVRFAGPGWFSLFSFGVLAASYVPAIYATGVEGYQVDRIYGSLYLLYAVLMVLNMIYWLGWLAQRKADAPRPMAGTLRVWQAALCLCMALWGVLGNGAVLATSTVGAYHSLLSGAAATYREGTLAREQALLEAQTPAEAQRVAGVFLEAQPNVIRVDMVPYQNESGIPADMHDYFAIQQLVHTYGPGKIPQSEWEALDEWLTQ